MRMIVSKNNSFTEMTVTKLIPLSFFSMLLLHNVEIKQGLVPSRNKYPLRLRQPFIRERRLDFSLGEGDHESIMINYNF